LQACLGNASVSLFPLDYSTAQTMLQTTVITELRSTTSLRRLLKLLRCVSKSQRTGVLAELSEFLWPGDEEDNGLNHTEGNDDVDHDVTIVRSSCRAASVHTTQCRPTVFKTHFYITNINSAACAPLR